MLSKVKLALRIKSDALNDEMSGLIAAAVEDLQLAGVKTPDAPEINDALLERAIIMYAKAHFGLDNKDAQKYLALYENLKERLTLAAKYQDKGGGEP